MVCSSPSELACEPRVGRRMLRRALGLTMAVSMSGIAIIGLNAAPAGSSPVVSEIATTSVVGGSCDVSADALTMAYVSGPQTITVMQAGQATTIRVAPSGADFDHQLALSDEGRYLAFVEAGTATGSRTVRLFDLETNIDTRVITSRPGRVHNLQIAPDGSAVVWQDTAEGFGEGNTMSAYVPGSGEVLTATTRTSGGLGLATFNPAVRVSYATGLTTQEPRIWFAGSGELVPDDLGRGQLSDDGARLLSMESSGVGETLLGVSDRQGNLIAEAVIGQSEAADFEPTVLWADNGARVLVDTGDKAAGLVAWDVESDIVTSIDVEGRLCGASPDGSVALVRSAGLGASDLMRVEVIDGRSLPVPVRTAEVQGPQLSHQIERLYRAVFMRAPDPAGADYWQDQRANRMSLRAIAQTMIQTDEFSARYGELDDTAFVERLYRNIVGREADQTGLEFWVGQLEAGSSRGDVVVGFSESPEFIARTGTQAPARSPELASVGRLYEAFLGRSGEDAGLQYWHDMLDDQDRTLLDIANSFASSPEFIGTHGGLTNQEFVEEVYDKVLGRAAEASGLQYWVGRLEGGLSRGGLMLKFSQSAEFVRQTDSLPPG